MEVQAFVPASFDLEVVKKIAANFSRRVREPVKVFYDDKRHKYRLCPLPDGHQRNISSYGIYCFEVDVEASQSPPAHEQATFGGSKSHIPRPRNSWILYRQHKYAEIKDQYPGLTAPALSTIIASMWRNESTDDKAYIAKRAPTKGLKRRSDQMAN
ncbi:hypothetical protein CDD81_5039 [Ophiocordyceps australis]|uniref:HMG box domain-containing protein n=1 Tax=Ophiocordyceps australis TaxID=1399860 RepID=A0A2C5Y8K9_9HYPO|nr:hypothetical protein CDD81_5039 [Ophiocordyceps australis]